VSHPLRFIFFNTLGILSGSMRRKCSYELTGNVLTLIHIKNDHGLLICLLIIWSLYGKEHTTELPVPLTLILLSAVFTSLYTNTAATIKLQNVSTVARKDKQNHHQQRKNKSLFFRYMFSKTYPKSIRRLGNAELKTNLTERHK